MATTAMKPAALSGRIIAAFIDGLILVVPFVILLQTLDDTIAIESLGHYRYSWGWILRVALVATYVISFHAVRGATPGKQACRIRVVTFADGSPIGWGRSALRYTAGAFGLVIQLVTGWSWIEPLWNLEVLVGLPGPWHLCLHDRVAGTVVVDAGPDSGPALEPG